MGLLDAFDLSSEEIIKPGHIASRLDKFPRVAVATFSDKVMARVRAYPGAVEICRVWAGFGTPPICQITHNGVRIAVFQTLVGGAGAAVSLEEVIARGGERFVFFGSCGTLDSAVSSGKLIVPTAAYRDEGTSYHYAPAGDYIDVNTSDKLSKILGYLGLPHIKAKTWTTDAFFRETRKNMLARKSEGCLAVDQECASVMAVGQFRGVEIYQYLYAEDNLDSDKWERRGLGVVSLCEEEKYLRVALDIAALV
ncbi:MAG: nucleoside phosphorylase [Oscillospiraceae bacterium]|nr:nucleoside phosphorylase [Oscillospiraceae bacterium]